MVGAVIVADGRIIGEGYHVRCGEGHAEVNAFASVRPQDLALLPESTIYVSLEPCSHYGRTPPCADLIVSKGVRRVVVGCTDPFEKVQGRGIERLRRAGIEVTVGVLEEECRWLNRRFFTAQTLRRPYIVLKWAQSADGFIDRDGRPQKFSTPFTTMLVHKLRSEVDAILVGRVTEEREHPLLTVRHWAGRSPRKLVVSHDHPLQPEKWAADGVQTLLVEGGAKTLQSFIRQQLFDEIRVETAPCCVGHGTPAPHLPSGLHLLSRQDFDGNVIETYSASIADGRDCDGDGKSGRGR